ncbi:ABC transporter permease [Parasalinivibrio latis]|uniref:ABC transporter permease n=1 Tax=Parasalinivibrio latis TaxID=2952610 RepID=UPI0030DEF0A1
MTLLQLVLDEFKAFFRNPSVVFVVIGGVVIYSLLYPLPYAEELPREQKVLVVDNDNSALSRELIRMVDATPQVNVIGNAVSHSEAAQAVVDRKAEGIIEIPRNFYRDVSLGKSPVIAIAGDASYFLVYGTVLEGAMGASGTLGASVKVSRDVVHGEPIEMAKQQYSAIRLNLKPVFNPTTGYVNYVVPAVFVLILHQTLLIGVGLSCFTQRSKGYEKTRLWKKMAAKYLVFGVIYLVAVLYYFGLSFHWYGVSTLAIPGQLWLVAVPYLAAVISLGLVIGVLLPRAELVTFTVLISSIPLVFSAGFIWPVEMIPGAINALVAMVPSTPGIQAFLRMNQMGDSFVQVSPLVGQLCLQALLYGAIAFVLLKRTSTE